MRLYQIYLGLRNPTDFDSLPETISKYLAGATIIQASGLWQGKVEPCVIIQHLAFDDRTDTDVQLCASALRDLYRQAEVWITTSEVTLTIIDQTKEWSICMT